VGIGLATAIKLTPAVFVLYLLLTRRWRPAAVAVGTSAAATGLAAALSPQTSLRYWTAEVWDTARVGPPSETGNQSVLGLLARLAAPAQPSRALWVLLAGGLLAVALRRAMRAAAQQDEVVGFTLTGLAGCLISPISWSHHLYWVVPAAVVLLDVAAGAPLADAPRLVRGRERVVRRTAGAAAGVVIAVFCAGLIWIVQSACRDGRCSALLVLVGEGSYGLVMMALVFVLPVRAPGSRDGVAETFADGLPSASPDLPVAP
jgi:alpha-1,2-mannosyltransferase